MELPTLTPLEAFPSVEAYYDAAPDPQARRFSPEVDYGVHWVYKEGRTWPEVYAVLLLAEDVTETEVERRLQGWAEEPHRPITWAWERLRRAPVD